jgi:hypothetical protein
VCEKATAGPTISPATLTLPVTTLETFLECPRRGFFVHDLQLSEPGLRPAESGAGPESAPAWDKALSPIARGRLAHAVLAGIDRCARVEDAAAFVAHELQRRAVDSNLRELESLGADLVAFLAGDVGRRLLALPPSARRPELPFELLVAGDGLRVFVTGQIDMLCWYDSAPWVIDYKHAHQAWARAEGYRLQLELYALAAERMCGAKGDVETSLVFLRDRSLTRTEAVSVAKRRALEARILDVARVMTAAPHARRPGVLPASCQVLGCGFFTRCYPEVAPSDVP